nr:hypothetical protein 1634Bnrm2_p156 [Cryptomonas sp.]
MFIINKLLDNIEFLSYFFLRKRREGLMFYVQHTWRRIILSCFKNIFEKKILNLIKTKKINYFVIIFKVIQLKIFDELNMNSTNKFFNESFNWKRLLYSYSIECKKKLTFILARKILCSDNFQQINNQIICCLCTRKKSSTEFLNISSFPNFLYVAENSKKITISNILKPLIVAEHFCFFCRIKTKTYHKTYLSKNFFGFFTPINIYTDIKEDFSSFQIKLILNNFSLKNRNSHKTTPVQIFCLVHFLSFYNSKSGIKLNIQSKFEKLTIYQLIGTEMYNFRKYLNTTTRIFIRTTIIKKKYSKLNLGKKLKIKKFIKICAFFSKNDHLNLENIKSLKMYNASNMRFLFGPAKYLNKFLDYTNK